MQLPPAPDEAARLAALYEYQILDTPPNGAFDDIARLDHDLAHLQPYRGQAMRKAVMDCRRQHVEQKVLFRLGGGHL